MLLDVISHILIKSVPQHLSPVSYKEPLKFYVLLFPHFAHLNNVSFFFFTCLLGIILRTKSKKLSAFCVLRNIFLNTLIYDHLHEDGVPQSRLYCLSI